MSSVVLFIKAARRNVCYSHLSILWTIAVLEGIDRTQECCILTGFGAFVLEKRSPPLKSK